MHAKGLYSSGLRSSCLNGSSSNKFWVSFSWVSGLGLFRFSLFFVLLFCWSGGFVIWLFFNYLGHKYDITKIALPLPCFRQSRNLN